MNSSGTARENQTESRHSHTNIGNNKPIRLALPHTRWRRKKKKEKDMWKRMDVGERKGERKECVWICIRNMNREKKQFNRDWSTSLRYSSGRSEYRLKSANLHIAQTDKHKYKEPEPARNHPRQGNWSQACSFLRSTRRCYSKTCSHGAASNLMLRLLTTRRETVNHDARSSGTVLREMKNKRQSFPKCSGVVNFSKMQPHAVPFQTGTTIQLSTPSPYSLSSPPPHPNPKQRRHS